MEKSTDKATAEYFRDHVAAVGGACDAAGVQFMGAARDPDADVVQIHSMIDAKTAAIIIGYFVGEFGLAVAMPAVLSKLRPVEAGDDEPVKFHGRLDAVDPEAKP